MANTLRFKRGIASGIPTALAGEPLFTTDTFDLYIGNGTTNTRFQKYIASGATTQILRGDGSLYTFPLAISSPSNGQVLKYNGTSWVNDSDAGITGSGTTNYIPKFTGVTTLGNSLIYDNVTNIVNIATASTRNVILRLLSNGQTSNQLEIGQGFASLTDNVGYIFNTASAALVLGTSYTERARIFATGNFGIGTGATDSGEKLQVTGTMKVTGASNFGGNITSSLNIISNNGTVDNRLSWSSTPAGVVGTISNHPLEFYTNGGVKMLLSASGNLGLAVTPSAWGSSARAIQVRNGIIWNYNNADNLITGANNYFDSSGTTYRYIANGFATEYSQDAGKHVWRTAPSGTAGNAITFTQAMTLTAAGRLLLNQTSDTGEQFQVTGTAKITGATTFGDNVNLNGGVITFGGGVSNSPYTNSSWIRGASGAGTFITNNGITAWLGLKSNGDLDYNGGFTILASTGAATFSSSVTAGGNMLIQKSQPQIQLYQTGADHNYSILGNTNTALEFWHGTFGSNTTKMLSLAASTGAATFSSSVTAASGIITGNLTVDTNTLFVDATNNRVGIGTIIPDTTFRVAGTANSTQAIFGSVDGRGLAISTSVISGTNEAGVIFNARSSVSSGTLIFQTDGTQRVQIDSTGLIINGGNALEFINSAANAVSAIRPTGGGTSVMSTNSNGLHIAVGTEAAGDLILASNNTERIRLSSSGWFSHTTATNPSSSVTDSYVQYSADVTAGNAAPHFRTENGAVIKLYQETTAVGNSIISLGGGNAVLDDTTFDGYTLRQIVKALRNQGILA